MVKDVGKHEKVIPLMLILKCKINKCSLMDKLKRLMVFCGDFHTPEGEMDSWNPHATHDSLKLFLACCARDDMDVIQVDYVMAYAQTKMRECMLVKLPEKLKQILPKKCGSGLAFHFS